MTDPSVNAQPLQTVRLQGDRVFIAADVAGRSDDPPVIFLHGGGQTRSSWGKAVRAVGAAGFRAIALDARGHGESDWAAADDDYALDRFVADLAAVIDGLDRKPALVGASMGGLSALIYAGETAPRNVTALALVDVAPRVEMKGATRIAAFMQGRPEGFADLEEAADAVAAYMPNRPRPRNPKGLLKNLRQTADGRYHWHWDPRFGQNSVSDSDMLKSNNRFRAAAQNLVAPTLLLRGALSDIVSHASVEEFRRLAPEAEYVDVAGADHMIAGDQNDAFNTSVIEFLVRRGV